MNLDLYRSLRSTSRCARHYPELRSSLEIPHAFGLFGKNIRAKHLIEPFEEFLEREKFSNSVQILQENAARARIVFRTITSSGDDVVVKWCNTDAPGCFNFIGSMEMERYMHGEVAPKLGVPIPECIRHGHDFIVIRYLEGEPLVDLMVADREDELIGSMQSLLGDLKRLYVETEMEALSAQQFNRLVHRDYQYGIHTRGTGLRHYLPASLFAPRSAQKRYERLCKTACKVFDSRAVPWRSCLTIRDLDEHNLRRHSSSGRIYAVDMEDARVANMVFDLAWLSTRVVLAERPSAVFGRIDPLMIQSINSVDTTDPDSSIALYKNLFAMQLTVALLNPWLWPSFSSFQRTVWPWRKRGRWLKEGWSVVDRLSSEGREKAL